MNAPAATVECPSCLGRSSIDAEHRHLSLWACPFCGASNAMPGLAPSERPARRARGSRVVSIAAACLVVVAIAASLAAQSAMPHGDYRTIEGLTAALADRGLECRSPRLDPAPPPAVRTAASCSLGASPVRLMTFGSETKRDRYRAANPIDGPAAIGRTWIAVTGTEAAARAIAGALGGGVQIQPVQIDPE